MYFKRPLSLIVLILFMGGCATTGMMTVGNIANYLGGKEAAQNKNPLIEAETDITLVDELAAIVKLNQVMLSRMPISYGDKWPELLNDYYHTTHLTEDQRKKRSRYNNCLKKLLKKDFSFYALYNANIYAVSIISTNNNILCSMLGALGSRMFIKGCENLGIEYEHVKTVLSYVPFGCDCLYYRPEFIDVEPTKYKYVCKRIRRSSFYRKCDFFNRPTEFMLTKYLYRKGGLKYWADLPIRTYCFRPVKGEQLGTFKDVFYSLLSPSIRSQIQRIDEEIMVVRADLESTKARLQCKGFSSPEIAALRRKKSQLVAELKNKQVLQKKLYKQALSILNVTPENIKKAKKLKEIADYIDRSFVENMSIILNLTAKIVNDVQTMKTMNITRAFVTYPLLVRKGVFLKRNRRFYERRFKNIAKKLIALPVTYFEILGYSVAQKYQVAKYKGYLEAMIKMEEKMNNRRKL